jgi:hypothetical protein
MNNELVVSFSVFLFFSGPLPGGNVSCSPELVPPLFQPFCVFCCLCVGSLGCLCLNLLILLVLFLVL